MTATQEWLLDCLMDHLRQALTHELPEIARAEITLALQDAESIAHRNES